MIDDDSYPEPDDEIAALEKRIAELEGALDVKCDDCVRHQDNVKLWQDAEKAERRVKEFEEDLWVRTRCSREKKVDASCTVCPWLTLCRVLRGEGD